MFVLFFTFLMINAEALEIIGQKSDSVVSCTREVTETSYLVSAYGACVESYEYPESSYISVLFTQSEKAEFDKLQSEIEQRGFTPTFTPEVCAVSAANPAPYLFLANKEDCSVEDKTRAGGCFELNVIPGFDMPDSYYLPEHLPEPAPYQTKIQVHVSEKRIKETCLPPGRDLKSGG